MSNNEHDNGTPGPPSKPALFDLREALLKEKDTVRVFGHMGPEDAREAERLGAEKDTDCAAEDEEDDTRY